MERANASEADTQQSKCLRLEMLVLRMWRRIAAGNCTHVTIARHYRLVRALDALSYYPSSDQEVAA